ncbi:MAG: ComEC/Rec2 family competence protein [Acidimicrobiales bacterium]
MAQLDFHFLNVGHGDCTFIDFPSGHLTLIDINNSKNLPGADEEALAEEKGLSLGAFKSARSGDISWEDYYKSLLVDPADYFDEHFAGRSIFRYIQTHPDMDHMSGLCRLFWNKNVSVANFWDLDHTKVFDEKSFDKGRFNWNDVLTYNRMRKGYVQDDDKHVVHNKLQGASGDYWTPDGISVLGPTKTLLDNCNDAEVSWNSASYVLRVDFGGRSVILPGDAEGATWKALETTLANGALACDILKAAHHGRESGYSETATEAMGPDYVICSVGKKPNTDASDEYKGQGATVLSTRYNGTICVRITDNGKVSITNHKDEEIGSLPKLT